MSEAVYEQLRDAILTGKLPVGHVLPGERRLCETLKVNRGALREALKRLDQDQLIEIQQGEGTRVRDFRESARVDLLIRLIQTPSGELEPTVARSVAELRYVITPDIARLAALRRSEEDVVRLKDTVAQLHASAHQMVRFQTCAEAYWSVLTEASQNVAYRLINNTMRQLHVELAHRLRSYLDVEFTNLARYAEIAQAVEDRDAARAETVARIHAEGITRSLGFKGVPRA